MAGTNNAAVGPALAMVYITMATVTADRMIFSVCLVPIQAALGLSLTGMGVLVSAYQWGYLALNLPGGALADRFGGLNVLIASGFLFSVMLALTPFALSSLSPYWAMLALRLAFGAASGIALPASTSLIGKMVAPEKRSNAVTTMFAAFNGGPVIGLMSGSLLAYLTWPSLFYGFGVGGAVLLGSLAVAVKRAMGTMPSSEKSESLLPTTQNAGGNVADARRGEMIVSRPFFCFQVVSLITCHSIINITYAMTNYWLPKYFAQDLHLSVAKSASSAALPFCTMAAAAFVCGRVGTWLISQGWSKLAVRRLMMAISHLGPACCLVVLINITDASYAVGTMMCLLGMHAFNAAGYHSHIQDVAASKAGTLLGTTNTCGMICSSISTIVVGYLVQETGSFKLVFTIGACLYCLGFCIFLVAVRADKLFAD